LNAAGIFLFLSLAKNNKILPALRSSRAAFLLRRRKTGWQFLKNITKTVSFLSQGIALLHTPTEAGASAGQGCSLCRAFVF